MKNKLYMFFLIVGCLVVTLSSGTFSEGGACIRTFNRYAFLPVNNTARKVITPLEPWQVELYLSSYEEFGPFDINAIRYSNQGEEIWITAHNSCKGCYNPENIEGYAFLVVNVETKEITKVPANIAGTSVVSADLFVREDDSIWARNEWNNSYFWGDTDWEHEVLGEQQEYPTIPILSRFNEEKQEFEFVKETARIPSYWMESGYPSITKVVMDEDGVFWFFAHNDGIYSYNPDSGEVLRHTALPRKISTIYVTQDNIIFFTEHHIHMDARFGDIKLYRFFQDTNRMERYETPNENWPVYKSILVDSTGRLWTDLVAVQEKDGEWNRLYPYLFRYEFGMDMNIQSWISFPYIMMESSNGYLWMRDYYRGRAWYDPESGEGCWFTTYGGNIIEDRDRRLWTVDDSLYSLSLDDLEE